MKNLINRLILIKKNLRNIPTRFFKDNLKKNFRKHTQTIRRQFADELFQCV